MNLNYIILAHKTPLQVLRLIDALNAPNINFFLHIDKNTPLKPFETIIQYSNVYFLKDHQRKQGVWGDIGIVEATLQAFQVLLKKSLDGFCILLSGQDYPLHAPGYISEFLNKNKNKIFMDIFPIPAPNWNMGGLNRISKYKVNWANGRGDFFLIPSIYQKEFYSYPTIGKIKYLIKKKKLNHLKLIFKKRNFPSYLKPYGGSQWMALPTTIVEEILVFTKKHQDYLEYHKYTLLPDEIFFQSIIMHINKDKDLLIKPSVTYANWSKKKGTNPAIFSLEDFVELKHASKNKLFARKFDFDKDQKILNLIDEKLLSVEQSIGLLSP